MHKYDNNEAIGNWYQRPASFMNFTDCRFEIDGFKRTLVLTNSASGMPPVGETWRMQTPIFHHRGTGEVVKPYVPIDYNSDDNIASDYLQFHLSGSTPYQALWTINIRWHNDITAGWTYLDLISTYCGYWSSNGGNIEAVVRLTWYNSIPGAHIIRI